MPVYLVHGFRWPRHLVRIHIILQNLDDAAPEWLIAPQTTATLLENFHTQFPQIMSALPNLRFIEQHDPFDLHTKSQPYAYVADVVHEVKLSTDIDDIRGRGVSNEQWAALVDLRDQLCKDQKVAWYVVVCGDEERWAPSLEETRAQKRERCPQAVTPMYGNGMGSTVTVNGNSKGSLNSRDRSDSEFTIGSGSNSTEQRPNTPSRLKQWFGSGASRLKKSKSLRSLRLHSIRSSTSISNVTSTDDDIPPLPPLPNSVNGVHGVNGVNGLR